MKTLDFDYIIYGQNCGTYEGFFYTEEYTDSGRMYVGMIAKEKTEEEDSYFEPFCDVTVNLFSPITNKNCGFLDTNNCPFIAELLVKNKLGKLTGRTAQSGWCTYPEFEFDMEAMKKYIPNDEEIVALY